MTIFFSADLHLGHVRCAENWRPFATVEEMNAGLIHNWNKRVKEDDTVYFLGDACMGTIAETLPLIATLNGRKILIPGNHDRCSPMYWPKRDKSWDWRGRYNEVFSLIVEYWATESKSIPFSVGNIPVDLSHFPYAGVDHTEEARYPEYRPVDRGKILLHGHTHNHSPVTGEKMIDVGQDAWNYTPVSEDEIVNLIRGAGWE